MWIDKVLSATGCGFLVAALGILCVTSPATGYEVSVYAVYPLYLWLFFIAAIGCGIGILVHQALTPEKSKWWIAGLLLVVAVNCVFLLLPIFRGYAIYGHGDLLTHVGYMKDILSSGHVGETNPYPMFHIFGVSLIEVAELSPGVTINILAACFSIAYITNMYLLAKAISKSQKEGLLLVAFASPLIFLCVHAKPYPHYIGVIMLPLILYFFHRLVFSPANRLKNATIMVLLSIFTVLVHPSTAVFGVALLLACGAAAIIYPVLVGREDGFTVQKRLIAASVSMGYGVGMMIVLLLSPATGTLAVSAIKTYVTGFGVRLLYGSESQTFFQHTWNSITGTGASGTQIAELVINQYGAIFLFLTIAGIAAFTVLVRGIIRAKSSSPLHFTYGILFIVAAAISAFLLFGFTLEYNVVRILRIALFTGAVVSGLVTYELAIRFTRKSNRWGPSLRRVACVAVITLFLVAVAAGSMGAVYHSPRVWSLSEQVPHMTLLGVQWFVETRDPSVQVAVFNTNYFRRLVQYHLGVDHTRRDGLPRMETISTHFGYDKHNQVADVFDYDDTYIAISPVDAVKSLSHPKKLRPQVLRYTDDDIANLRNDVTVSHIYSGGQFEIWRTHGQ